MVSRFSRDTVMAGLAVTLSLMVWVAGGFTWTVGIMCLSVSNDESVRFTRIMPTPPPRRTSALLAVRSTTPRSQTTTLPATLAGSSEPGAQSAALPSPLAALVESTTPAPVTSRFMMDAPRNLLPSENSTVPWSSCEKEVAATVVNHGAPWFTVLAVGPELPAEVATKMPAEAADRNANDTGSVVDVVEPEME
ncbi:hypothetical protein D3C73_828540 [compost metagenome]